MSKVLTMTALATVLSAALSAQAPQTPTPAASPTQTPTPSAPPSAPRSSTASSVVVQGCIQPSVNAVSATPDAVGTSGSVSTATAFILTSAERPTGTSGSSASPSTPIASTYQLAVEDSKLIPHVGHKVEISGTVMAADKSSPAARSAGGLAPAPTLKVENVKMIAETCTP
jgi:hypothetical protein